MFLCVFVVVDRGVPQRLPQLNVDSRAASSPDHGSPSSSAALVAAETSCPVSKAGQSSQWGSGRANHEA